MFCRVYCKVETPYLHTVVNKWKLIPFQFFSTMESVPKETTGMFILDYVIYRIVAVMLEMFWDKIVLGSRPDENMTIEQDIVSAFFSLSHYKYWYKACEKNH
jgi:hypothetical protein